MCAQGTSLWLNVLLLVHGSVWKAFGRGEQRPLAQGRACMGVRNPPTGPESKYK